MVTTSTNIIDKHTIFLSGFYLTKKNELRDTTKNLIDKYFKMKIPS